MDMFYDYIRLFVDGDHQLVSLGAAVVLFVLLSMLGAPFGGRYRIAEATPVFGWSVAVTVLTALNAIAGTSFVHVAIGLLVLSGLAAAWAWRDGLSPFPPGGWRVAVLLLPALIIASAMVPSQWDEFSHWVPTLRFLSEFHAFPNAETPVTGGFFPAYPYNWSLLGYLGGLIGLGYLDNLGGLLNLLLLGCFGMLAARLAVRGAGGDPETDRGWKWAGLAVVLATLVNPTFVEKIVLTAYADTSTAVATAFTLVFGWMLIEALGETKRQRGRSLAWQFALSAAVLVNIKQSNPALLGLIVIGLVALAWRDPRIEFRRFARHLPVMLGLPLIMFAIWRFHVMTELPPSAEAGFLPFSQWSLGDAHLVLWRMLTVAIQKTGHFGLGVAAVVIGVMAWRRCHTPLRRLAFLTAVLFVGFNGFLWVMYLTQFGQYDALRAASFWRYNMQIGLAVLAFAAFAGGVLWKERVAQHVNLRRVGWLPLALALIAPPVFAHKLRFDLEPPKPHFHAVGAALSETLPAGATVTLFDVHGSGESFHLTRYYMWKKPITLTGYLSAYQTVDAAIVRHRLDGVSHVLVHSANAPVRAALGLPLPRGTSYLIARGTDDTWSVVGSWPYSDDYAVPGD